MTNASRGELWLADLNPTRGHEQAVVIGYAIFCWETMGYRVIRLQGSGTYGDLAAAADRRGTKGLLVGGR